MEGVHPSSNFPILKFHYKTFSIRTHLNSQFYCYNTHKTIFKEKSVFALNQHNLPFSFTNIYKAIALPPPKYDAISRLGNSVFPVGSQGQMYRDNFFAKVSGSLDP